MKQAVQTFRRFKFGMFEADIRTGELTKLGKRVRLQEQPFQLLAILLEKPGELVIREELCENLWPKTIVDCDHGLNKAISKVREALGDSAENPRFIETVASRGYRFLADVTIIQGGQPLTSSDDLTAGHKASGLAQLPDAGTSAKWPAPGWGLAAVVTVLTLAVFLSWSFHSRTQRPSTIHSLAVLPLENLSNDA